MSVIDIAGRRSSPDSRGEINETIRIIKGYPLGK
jgi:hypothetical protein